MDNRSKKYHYHIVRPILDYSLVAPEVQWSSELYPILNSYPSIVDVTMDFSIATILHPDRKNKNEHG